MPKSTVARAQTVPIKHSIADFLASVKTLPLSNEIFSEDVANRLGVTRSVGVLSDSLRHALPKKARETDADEMIERAVMRGYGDKSGANSQTSEKAKPKRTAAQVAMENAERRAAVEMAQVEEKAARTVRRVQKSAENAVKNAETLAAQKITRAEEQAARRVRNAEKSAKNATKNAEKKLAAETERLARESMEHIYRSSRESARLNKNIEYLKNEVLHRKSTEGGLASSIIFGEPSLRAVVKVFAGRGSAGGVTISQRNTIRRFIDTCLARNCSKLCRGGVLSAGRRDNILAAFLYTRNYTKCLFLSFRAKRTARRQRSEQGAMAKPPPRKARQDKKTLFCSLAAVARPPEPSFSRDACARAAPLSLTSCAGSK